MTDLDSIRGELQGLGKEVAGLRPLVLEMNSNMPRIAVALETLARVTEKLESNTEDHKRIHFRITENERALKELSGYHDDLERRFESLRDDHIVCTTTTRVERTVAVSSLWEKIKVKVAEKTVEIFLVAMIGFVGWLVVVNLPRYPVTAPIVEQGRP